MMNFKSLIKTLSIFSTLYLLGAAIGTKLHSNFQEDTF